MFHTSKKCFSIILSILVFSQLCAMHSAHAEEPVTIGLLNALTGPFADTGEDCRRGIEIARRSFAPGDSAAGHTLKFIYEDSQADPKVGVSAFNKLIDEEHAQVVITVRSPIGMAINPISKKRGIPIIGAVGHRDFVPTNEYAFQVWPTTTKEGAALAESMLTRGDKSVAIITAQDEWTVSFSEGFRNHFKELGGTVLLDESVLGTDTDFSAVLTKARGLKPQAVFINLGFAPNAAAIRRARQLGITQHLYSNFWIGDPAAIQAAGAENAEGVAFIEMKLGYPKMEAALAQNFPKKRTSAATFSCYASTATVLAAIKKVTGPTSPESLYRQMLNTPEVELLDEPFHYINRSGEFHLVLKTIHNGTVVE